jgi:hypothetical protein
MPRSLFARLTPTAAVALCGWLAVPPLAVAGGVAYFGPVNQPGNAAATVHLIVGTKKVGKKRAQKPFELRRFTEFWVRSEPCIPNPPFPPSGVSYKQVKVPEELLPIPIKKGSFSASVDAYGDGFTTFEISGTVPRKGPASGTLRLTSTESVQHAPGPPPPSDPEERDHESVTCDTGVLSWEASVYQGPTDRTVHP